jgi:hypothetical protein
MNAMKQSIIRTEKRHDKVANGDKIMNVKIIKTLATALVFAATVFTNAMAEVPNTFSADTPALAAEVNENFADLDARITSIQNSSPNLGGYGVSWSAAGAPKNVVVLARLEEDGGTRYSIRSRYANTNETIIINDTPTQRPFIANYAGVKVDSGGNIIWIGNTIEAPDTENYIVYNVELSSYDPGTLSKTIDVDGDTTREDWSLCNGGETTICYVDVLLSATGEHVRSYAWSSIRGLSGPVTVNGMTFDDVRLEQNIASDNVRVRAKGVGEILRTANDGSWERRLIFYRANGIEEGDLTGTPFASGQPLADLFF